MSEVIVKSAAFFVPGQVRGTQRHRAQLRGNKIHIHRTNSEIHHSTNVAECFWNAHPNWQVWEGPVRMEIEARVLPPKSAWPGKHATTKPDWDNVGKLVSDALNKLAYRDDAQIVDGHVKRRYCVGEEPEGVMVVVSCLAPVEKPSKARKAAADA